MVGCTKMMCRPRHDGEIVVLKGDAESCDYKGKMYKKGDSFMDDCNHCFCGGNDRVGCTRMRCIHSNEKPQTFDATLEDSETCTFKGKTYKKGENFKIKCNTCFCGGNNIIGCTIMACPEDFEDDFAMTCTHKGKTYNIGDNFKDDCNRCFCGANGNVGCTRMMCLHPEEPVDYKTATCTLKGKTYNMGESFMDDCNSCYCGGNGNAICTLRMCIHPEALTPYVDSDSCKYNGKVYKKGDNFPSTDGCNSCFCGGNDIVGCTRMACRRMGCMNNGNMVAIGQTFKKDCNTCVCTKNGGVCTTKACISHY